MGGNRHQFVKTIKDTISDDRSHSKKKIEEIYGIDKSSVYHILSEKLKDAKVISSPSFER